MRDAWAPAAFLALGRFVPAPRLDLTIHVRRPLPVTGELWSPGGDLIAQSRQLALVLERPP